MQDSPDWYLASESDQDWDSLSEGYVERGTAPMLFPYEEAESPQRAWTTVGRKMETAKTFQQFEQEERERSDEMRRKQAADLARRKAGRPATPPEGDIPGVPGRLVAKKPVAQSNKYSALSSK